MSPRYYQIIDDVTIKNRWFLKAPVDIKGKHINPEIFRIAKKANVSTPLTISLRRPGKPLDFTFADFDMPVTSKKTTDILSRLARSSIQFLPAEIENNQNQFMIMNVLDIRNCVNESASEFLKWSEFDNRPDKVGQYRQITRLRINPKMVNGLHVFRIEGWRIALIVSEELRTLFLETGITGVNFIKVT